MAMQCGVGPAVVFILISLTYGSAFAGVAQGMLYYSPSLMISYRMLFGAVTCFIILLIRIIFNKGYLQIVRAHFNSGVVPFLWMACGGLLFHGLPHCIIAIAQQWVSSASVQIAQPLATCAGSIFAHFALPDEKFNCQKALTLVFALSGVALTAVPSFLTVSDTGSAGFIALGYILLIIGCSFFGIAPVVMKWKTPNVDITVSSCTQTLASFIVVFIWTLIYDGPKKVSQQTLNAPPIAWVWPILIGTLATGAAAHAFIYLVSTLGANGANFITFGQILIGVIIGVAFMGEWDKYNWWQIFISIVGIILLCIAIGIGFYKPKAEREAEKAAREEEQKEDEIEMKSDDGAITLPDHGEITEL